MIVIVAGFDAEATRRLSQELRAAGHQVLGAQGRHGTRTFLHATAPHVVVVPTEDAARVREWTADLGMALAFVEVAAAAPDGAGSAALRRFAGEPEPTPPPAPEPEPEPAPAPVVESEAVVVETGNEPLFHVLGHRMPPPEPADSGEPVDYDPPELPARRGGPPRSRRVGRGDALPAGPLETRDTGRQPRPALPPGVEAHPDLVAKLAQVRFADYFQILEVEPSGSTFQAREAHERLARRYTPRGWSARLMPEEIDMLDEIARGIADAALVLTDPELRARYERALGGAGVPRRGP